MEERFPESSVLYFYQMQKEDVEEALEETNCSDDDDDFVIVQGDVETTIKDKRVGWPKPQATEEEKAVEHANFLKAFLSSTSDAFKYAIISKETEKTLKEISDLCRAFFSDLDVSYFDMIVGMMLLNVYHHTSHIKTEITVKKDIIADGLYYMRFANAVYGWKLIYGYNFKERTTGLYRGFANGDKIQPQVLAEHTGVKIEDLILTKWKSTAFDPGHYMTYDHSRGSIVISLRGTFHIKDCLTDLVASNEPFMEGFAHCGILRTASNKFEVFYPYLLDALKTNPDYDVQVVGHSLGAGTATLLTLMIKEKLPDLKIHCHAFAPPCVVSLDIATRCKYFVTSYVVGDDLIPRLSYGSVEDLKRKMVKILDQESSFINRMGKVIITGGGVFGDSAMKKIEKILQIEDSVKMESLGDTQGSPSNKLWIAGKVYHIYKNEDATYEIEESAPSLFSELKISSRMFLDHMPDHYENVLADLLKKTWKAQADLSLHQILEEELAQEQKENKAQRTKKGKEEIEDFPTSQIKKKTNNHTNDVNICNDNSNNINNNNVDSCTNKNLLINESQSKELNTEPQTMELRKGTVSPLGNFHVEDLGWLG